MYWSICSVNPVIQRKKLNAMFTQIITPTADSILLSVPHEMVGRKVKITLDTVEQREKPIFNSVDEVHAAFSAIRLDTLGWKFNRDEANER
jgi:hypothetical protein